MDGWVDRRSVVRSCHRFDSDASFIVVCRLPGQVGEGL